MTETMSAQLPRLDAEVTAATRGGIPQADVVGSARAQ